MEKRPPIEIRAPAEPDLAFIYSSFIKSLANQRQFEKVERNLLAAMLHGLHTRLLKQGNTLVACDPADRDQVYGYIVYGVGVLYWVFTKYDFRGNGVGTALMDAAFGDRRGPVAVAIPTSASKHLNAKWGLVDAPWRIKGER
jgi:GNAT superfamily N-acetyltransferase